MIVYDVACPTRRRRLSRHAEDAGFRVQRSVFTCSLDKTALEAWLAGAVERLNAAEDSLRCYPLCGRCLDGIRSAGPAAAAQVPGPKNSALVI